MTAFTAIIFDFGGVVTSSPFEAFNRLEEARGFRKDSIRRINSTNPDGNAWALFERAEIDAAQFDMLFANEAAMLDIDLRGADVLQCLAGDVRPQVVEAIDRLRKSGFQLGCITNNVPAGKGAGMALDDTRADEIAAVMGRFDHVIESSKAGVRKPDPRIYEMMCKALSVPPERCIYLDDLGINCKPAAAMGMTAIKVTSGPQALDALEKLVGMDLR